MEEEIKKLLKNQVSEIMTNVVHLRRTIHKNPEVGREEFETSKLIKSTLEEYGIENITSPTETSIVAIIEGKKEVSSRCIALRADIDALPVEEDTGLEFSSRNKGYMHACGHDLHTAMLLGASKILYDNRHKFSGIVKLIFQHSEDTLPGGAKELVEKGVLDNPNVDAIIGIHVLPKEDENNYGKIYFREGPLTTSVDLYNVKITGKGGHGSQPHKAKDPILAGCQMVNLLQQIPARYVDPLKTVIMPVCSFHGGDAPNIIPGEASFSTIARAYVEDVRETVKEQVFSIASGMESISGCKVEVEHYKGYPACYNDEELTKQFFCNIGKVVGDENVEYLKEPMSFSEDFSYYTQLGKIKGCYMLLSCGNLGKFHPLHNKGCTFREEAMENGILALCTSVFSYLDN